MKIRVLPLALLATCVVVASPQLRPAEIRGRVVEAATKLPVRGAAVWIGDLAAPQRFLTGPDGRFVLRNVSPATVTLWASKHGYFSGGSGRRRPTGTTVPLVIADGDRLTDLEILVWPMATISGTVTDERAEPIAGVSVVVTRQVDEAPGALRESMGPIVGLGVTDDTGRYSVQGLGAGEYVAGIIVNYQTPNARELFVGGASSDLIFSNVNLKAVSAGATRFTNPPASVIVGGQRLAYGGTFYGGVRDPSLATTIRLRDGEERTGVDLRLEPQPTARISGNVTGAAGPLAGVQLKLSSGSVTASTESRADGSFVFSEVPVGTYSLSASGTRADSIASANTPPAISGIVANRDVSNLTVALGAGPTVSGLVTAAADVDIASVRIRLQHAGSTSVAASAVVSRGRFALPEVPPGRYVIRVDPRAAGVVLESVELAGRNVTDVPFEVVTTDVGGLIVHLTSRPAIVSGSVNRPDGTPSTIASVVLFPADASTWSAPPIEGSTQFRAKRVSGGGYYFENVPRGDYYLAAVDDALLRNWHDRSLLQSLMAKAVRISVTPGLELQRDLIVDEQ